MQLASLAITHKHTHTSMCIGIIYVYKLSIYARLYIIYIAISTRYAVCVAVSYDPNANLKRGRDNGVVLGMTFLFCQGVPYVRDDDDFSRSCRQYEPRSRDDATSRERRGISCMPFPFSFR